MSQHITFYISKVSPFTSRVEIALQEGGVEATRYEVDLYSAGDKLAWYKEKINPLRKVPAITYGPPHPPDQPTPESVAINESLVIVEFIADLYPSTNLVPKDPVQKAKANMFARLMDSTVLPALQDCIFAGKKDITELYAVFDLVQSQLPDGARYAVGDDFTIADIAAASFFCLLEMMLKNDIGKYEKGDGLKAFEVYNSTKYDKLRNYVGRLSERPSVKKGIQLDIVKETFGKRLARES